MSFHKYLKLLITDRRLTQRAVAAAMKIDTGYLSKLVNNQSGYYPNSDTLENLTDALQCTAAERIELYRLAGRIPPELQMIFCRSAQNAKGIYAFVFDGKSEFD